MLLIIRLFDVRMPVLILVVSLHIHVKIREALFKKDNDHTFCPEPNAVSLIIKLKIDLILNIFKKH